jgi:hypothetical protein
MGAWGSGSFENDDASDWVADLCDDPDKEVISDALSAVVEMEAGEYLEAPDCSVGLAAAEVVAALKGSPNPGMPDDARKCVSKLKIKANAGMVSLALKAVERIKTDSELKELWDEAENPAEWYEAVGNLEARLKQ